MVFREDVWVDKTCLVCQSTHESDDEKKQHAEDETHKKKVVIFDFLSKELQVRAPSTMDSILFERFSRANTLVIGLDCICELRFDWSKTPLWVCTVCYVAGRKLDSADTHIHSSAHRQNYLAVHYTEIGEELIAQTADCPAEEQSLREYRVVQRILYDVKCLSPPDVYIFDDCRRKCAFNMLGLEEGAEAPARYIVEPISDSHQLVQCLVCGENFFAYENGELLQQAWHVHLSSNHHQKCQMMLVLLDNENLEEKEGIPQYCYNKTETAFNEFNGAYYGSTCGYEFLVDFENSNECFCLICFCVISKSVATEHFSCEYHIERFVRRFGPSKLLGAEYMKVEDRHEILIDGLTRARRVVARHRCSKRSLPKLLREFALLDRRSFDERKIDKVSIGAETGIWCKECTQYIELIDGDDWNTHIMDEEHFEYCTKRALYYIDEKLLVSNSVALPPFRKTSKGWEDKFSVTAGCTISTQDHCYYGLQYVVRDELSRVFICLGCHFMVGYEDDNAMSKHVRSLSHLTRIMHFMNKKFLGVLWKNNSADECKKLLLDYLKHCKLDPVVDKPIVYDPVSALNANCYGKVSRWLLDLSKLPPETREISLASLKLEDFAKDKVVFNQAMRAVNVEIRHIIESSIVLFCQECNQSFSSNMNDIRAKFAEHLFSISHWNRQQSLRENRLDENKRVLGQTSSFVVTPFFQVNQKKKVTWKWNETRKAFEFVYAQLGMTDIRERKNFKTKRDLYCNLCAETIKAAKNELENHIRSFSHIFYYTLNHCSQSVPELEEILLETTNDIETKHKKIRRYLAKTLKDFEKEKGDILIYDMSMNFCEIPAVKNVINCVDSNGIQPGDLIKNGPHNFIEESESAAIYAQNFEHEDPAIIQQLLVYMINTADTNEMSIDNIRKKVLTASISKPQSSSNAAKTRDSSSGAALTRDKESSSDTELVEMTIPESSGRTAHKTTTSTTSNGASRSRSNRPSSSRTLKPPSRVGSPVKEHAGIINRIFSSSSTRASSSAKAGRKASPVRTSGRSSLSRPCRSRSPRRVTTPNASIPSFSTTTSSSLWNETTRDTKPRKKSRWEARSRSPSATRKSSRSTDKDIVGGASRLDPSRFVHGKMVANEMIKSSAANKIQFNITTKLTPNETTPALQSNYRIRNAPADPITHIEVDPVDPHAEDDSPVKRAPPPIAGLSFRLGTMDVVAHAKAVEEFLSKTTGIPVSTTTATVPPPMMPTQQLSSISPQRVFPPNLFGALPPGMPPLPIPPGIMAAFGSLPPKFPSGFPLFFNTPAPFPMTSSVSLPSATLPTVTLPSAAPSVPAPAENESTAELVMRAKMELCQRDLVNIRNISELIDYMWNQGFDKISPSEKPLLFNQVVKKRRGALGCNMLYHIICYGHDELETFYCGMCNLWTTVSEMFTHLCSALHRTNYMFRNYKLYHRRAMEEPDEKTRNQFLEQMAEKIWDLEGSGQCTNRMRCVLNDAAIFRIWPDVVKNIDHSWKLDLDLADLKNATPTKAPLSTSDIDGTPMDSEAENDETINNLLKQYRGDIASQTTRGAIRFDETRKSTDDRNSRNSEKKASKEHRGELDHRERDRDARSRKSPTMSRKRKDRSASPRRHRLRSRSPSATKFSASKRHRRSSPPASSESRHKKGSSADRHSKSRNDDKRTSKSKSPLSSESLKSRPESWDEKAAAFLDRIGNRREATRLYLSALDKPSGASLANDDGDEILPPATSAEDLVLTHDRNSEIRQPNPMRIMGAESVEDRLRSVMSFGEKMSNRAQIAASELAAEISRMDASNNARPASMSNRVEQPTRFAKLASGSDDKADMRKTIGVIVELQSIFETEKFVDGETIFKVCEDMGIAAKNTLVNALLRETAQMYGVDLPSAYETWITRRLIQQQNQQQQQKQQQQRQQMAHGYNSVAQNDLFKSVGGLSSEIMDILRKVDSVKASTSAGVDNANIDLGFRRGQYKPIINADVNFVYTGENEYSRRDAFDADVRGPGSSTSAATAKRNVAAAKSGGKSQPSHDSAQQINASINRLTYAFGDGSQRRNGMTTASVNNAANYFDGDNVGGSEQDFQRFNDENDDENNDESFDSTAQEASLEHQRSVLQNLAEAKGLRPEIAAAAAAAAISQQRQTIEKRKRERKPKANNGPNSNLEPLSVVRSFGTGAFADSGASGRESCSSGGKGGAGASGMGGGGGAASTSSSIMMPRSTSVTVGGSGTGSSYAVNANLLNMASQVGDDWGSLNNYLGNLLKKPTDLK